MSNQSLTDTFSTTVKKAEKADAGAKPGVITAPPHFGDIGKAANDTFSKVPPPDLPPLDSIERVLTLDWCRTFLFQVCIDEVQ